MSDLTPCNYCTLQLMKRAAKKRGTKVVVIRHMTGQWKGWTTAYMEDNQEQSRTRFLKLGDHCEC